MAGSSEGQSSRIVLISPWIWVTPVICCLFIGFSIYMIVGFDDPASPIIGIATLAISIAVVVGTAGNQIAILDQLGFRVLLHRKVPWTSVQWADVEEVPSWGIPNYAITITSKNRTGPAEFGQYSLSGFASFRAGGRLRRNVDVINDWIRAANPGETINPWLRRTQRDDNR